MMHGLPNLKLKLVVVDSKYGDRAAFLISEESDSLSHISYRSKYFPVNGSVNLVECRLALQG
jgi:hypothetical protein